MKKLFVVVLLCALFLSGCTVSQGDQNTDSTPAPITDNNSACEALLTLDTYEEYTAFVSENGDKLPAGFVTWDNITILGEVTGIVFFSWTDYTTYAYSFVDGTGLHIGLTVRHTPKVEEKKIVTFNPAMLKGDTLVKIHAESEEPLTVIRNGVEYGYSLGGYLITITFYKNNIQYTINDAIYDYPSKQTDTLVGKLISADEAVANAALEELTEKLSK